MKDDATKPFSMHRDVFDSMTQAACDANAEFYSVTYRSGEGSDNFSDGLEKLMREHSVTGIMAVMPKASDNG